MSQTHRLPEGGRIDRSKPLSFRYDGREYQDQTQADGNRQQDEDGKILPQHLFQLMAPFMRATAQSDGSHESRLRVYPRPIMGSTEGRHNPAPSRDQSRSRYTTGRKAESLTPSNRAGAFRRRRKCPPALPARPSRRPAPPPYAR